MTSARKYLVSMLTEVSETNFYGRNEDIIWVGSAGQIFLYFFFVETYGVK